MACWKIHYFLGWCSYWNPISSGFPIATFHSRRSGGYASSNIKRTAAHFGTWQPPGFAARPPDASARTLALLGGLRRTLGGGRGEVTVEVRGRVDGVKPRQKIKGSNWWMMVEWWLNGWWLGLYHPLSWDYHWIIDEWRLYSYTPTREWLW